ncbi:MAG: hypothetical protein J4O08_03010, partial [Chloroflexi bacterium]|nr:hypothetical protein [Chloroflexota bacterium]
MPTPASVYLRIDNRKYRGATIPSMRNLAILIMLTGLVTTACFFGGDDDETVEAQEQSDAESGDAEDKDGGDDEKKQDEDSGADVIEGPQGPAGPQ